MLDLLASFASLACFFHLLVWDPLAFPYAHMEKPRAGRGAAKTLKKADIRYAHTLMRVGCKAATHNSLQHVVLKLSFQEVEQVTH